MSKPTEITSPSAESTPTLSRDEMRAKIFGAKPKSEMVYDFFGTTLELRQPTLAVALAQRNNEEEDRLYLMLTDYAFVPGTDEKVFESGDIDSLRTLPFGPEFTSLMGQVNKLLGINPEGVEKAIEAAEKSA